MGSKWVPNGFQKNQKFNLKHTGEEQLDDIIRCEVNCFHRFDVRLIMRFSRVGLMVKYEFA